MTSYDLGDDVILTLRFTVADVLTDPTPAPTCKVAPPSGAEATVALTKLSTGVYEGVFTPTLPGEHWYRGAGLGPAKAAGEDVFFVRTPHVP